MNPRLVLRRSPLMVMSSHSCILRDYELSITQQPISTGHQGKTRSSLCWLGLCDRLILASYYIGTFVHPVPVCHLRPRLSAFSPSDDRLHSLMLYCTLEIAHPEASSSNNFDPLGALSGSTVVGPIFDYEPRAEGSQTSAGCCFIFRDLDIRAVEGLYRLRFTLFETVQ